MKRMRVIGLLAVLAVLAACADRNADYGWSENAPRVVAIDSLLQQQPDSALSYLLWFDSIDYGGAKVPYNHYLDLMLSEAAFKVRREVVMPDRIGKATLCFDSLAAVYSKADNVAFLQARAHYMNAIGINNGIIYEDDSITMMSCTEYYKALEVMESHFADEQLTGHKAAFMALIYARLANIYSDKFLIEPTVNLYENVLKYKKKAGNPPSSMANTLFFLGYEYEKSEQFDSALYYYDQSLACMKDTTGVLYRNVINRKALSSYQVGHDASSSVAALKRIAVAGSEFEMHDRLLGVGYIYKLDQQYDSAVVYLSRVFDEAPNLFLKTQSADYLREIYEELGDAKRAGEYARFVAQNTPPEFGTKADEWRFTSLFQEYQQQKQDRARLQEARESRSRVMKLVLPLLALLVVALVWIVAYRRRHQRLKAEQQVLTGRLQEQGEVLSAMQKRVEAATFAEEPVCRQILDVVHDQQFKSKIDYLVYKDYALSKEQLLALREAADMHFGQFTTRLKKAYPALTKGDVDYCCLYLLGLEEADVAALMQRAYNTVCERTRKLKAIFGSEDTISTILRDFAKNGTND